MGELRYVLIGAHLRPEDARAEGAELLEAGDLVLSAIAIDRKQSLADREVVTRAAQLRQELAAREIFVAIRYGASAADAADAAGKVAPHLERWKGLLERWRGRAELTLRAGGGAAKTRPDRAAYESGADYLRALQQVRGSAPVDPRFVADAETMFARVAEALRVIRREDGGTEIAMLLGRSDIAKAADLAGELRRAHPSVPFLLSGPWPLEVFADEP